MELNKIYLGDCLEVMKEIPTKSIDMILCDLPYGTTACKWDTIIPFEPLWKEYKRIIKDNGAIVLTASQPFTSALVMSNPDMFKYEWIWEKERPSNIFLMRKQAGKVHENVLVFYKKQCIFNPVMTATFNGKTRLREEMQQHVGNSLKHQGEKSITSYRSDWDGGLALPRSVQYFIRDVGIENHPTQKPVELFAYLIKTYTNEGDLVLDNCAGSGTTGVACKMLGRNYILIEKEPEYIKIINDRIKSISNPLF